MPNSVFFDIFFKPKFFDETCFIKELAKSMAVKLSENFTNHFSVICLFVLWNSVVHNYTLDVGNKIPPRKRVA